MDTKNATFRQRLEEAHDFPTEYTFKLIGDGAPIFRTRLTTAMASVLPGAKHSISTRATRSGRHQSITIDVVVPDAPTVESLYSVFSKVEGLKVML